MFIFKEEDSFAKAVGQSIKTGGSINYKPSSKDKKKVGTPQARKQVKALVKQIAQNKKKENEDGASYIPSEKTYYGQHGIHSANV